MRRLGARRQSGHGDRGWKWHFDVYENRGWRRQRQAPLHLIKDSVRWACARGVCDGSSRLC